MVSIAILGHGVVGSGVAEVLLKNGAGIAQKAGEPIEVRRLLDLREFPDSPFCDRFTNRFEEIVQDEKIRIVVETMGGLHPAYDYVKASLLAGKSVVTSNKELVAEKGDELLAMARERNLNFLFEASVGGGIPILHPLDECFGANEVYEIAGILNGTTNFMLTQMIEEGVGFEEALSEAQRLGYAERNPSADVDGLDACRKVCVLASLAFGRHVYPSQVHTEGIRTVTREDVVAAEAAGGVIKLIGRVRKAEDGRLYAMVVPTVLPKTSLLSDVRDVFNAILVRGDAIGDVVFYGRGAGKLPTASAVVADIIDEVKHLHTRKRLFWEKGQEDYVLPVGDWTGRYLVRFQARERQSALSEIQAALEGAKPVDVPSAPEEELTFVTAEMSMSELEKVLGTLRSGHVLGRFFMADF